jgi:PhnB protein
MASYQGIFGGTLESSTFKEYHVSEDPGEDDKAMHSALKTENGMTLMASDAPNRMEHTPGSDFSLSLSGDAEAELRGSFEKLAADGTVTMPLEMAGASALGESTNGQKARTARTLLVPCLPLP